MNQTFYPKSILLLLLAVSVLALASLVLGNWTHASPVEQISNEKVQLALRRTAHHLLRLSGDSTSRIPVVERLDQQTWLVRLERFFPYDSLPGLLQASFDLHGIQGNYDVAVLRCLDNILELGYNYQDYSQSGDVPCGGRSQEDGCYNLQVRFAETPPVSTRFPWEYPVLFGGVVLAAAYAWRFRRHSKAVPESPEPVAEGTEDWIVFGQSRMLPTRCLLRTGDQESVLTYREAKLLQLFLQHRNQLLERSFIQEQVWADEGIITGRSLDVFVSRLRKLLQKDTSVKIVAVHGVGYRFDVAG